MTFITTGFPSSIMTGRRTALLRFRRSWTPELRSSIRAISRHSATPRKRRPKQADRAGDIFLDACVVGGGRLQADSLRGGGIDFPVAGSSQSPPVTVFACGGSFMKKFEKLVKPFRIEHGKHFRLKDHDPGHTAGVR